MPECPRCHGRRVVRNGFTHNGRQQHRCNDCGRRFVVDPRKQRVSDERRAVVDGLLAERLSLAGIARAVGVSLAWLYAYRDQKYAATPRRVEPATAATAATAAKKGGAGPG